MVDIFTKFVMWLAPKCLYRNGVSEEMLRSFFAHILNPKYVVLNWLMVRSNDACHDRLVNMYNLLMSLPRNGKYDEELDYCSRHALELTMFPYDRIRDSECPHTGVEKGMPFVFHGDKKVFFPARYCCERAASLYRGFVDEEGILGTGCLRKHPHSYVTDLFKVDEGDIILDVGSAEGLFALDNIERASKVYVFESMKIWRRPLAATFAAFSNKVSIVNKYVGSKVSRKTTTLDEILKSESEDATYFIKMDIEGAEREVLCASESFLTSHRVKLACAVYHRHDDAEFIKAELERIGFSVEFSDGYILTSFNDFIYPYFRRGMIYAKNY